ncbi:uncharacterized protein [Typha latifolia]|uniref:uncharacterized protein isoform X1 n=2 Tax=Typha latifolia TaxID=4733 RepID=UPI003C2D8348
MESEGSHDIQVEAKFHKHFVQAANPSKASSGYKVSKSDSNNRVMKDGLDSLVKPSHHPKLDSGNLKGNYDINKNTFPGAEVRGSLKQEILELEKHLQDQVLLRSALEKAMSYKPTAINLSNDISAPKLTKELIKEIAVLELEVTHLEQYLLSLYRKAFDQQRTTLSSSGGELLEEPLSSQSGQFQQTAKSTIPSKRGLVDTSHLKLPKKYTDPVIDSSPVIFQEKLQGPGVHRSHSILSQRVVCSDRISPTEESLARALRACHSRSISFHEEAEIATSGVISLADYLGTDIADHIPETPNKLSEDMVRCMAGIYCKLANPPLVHHGPSSSPTSSFSSMSALSPQYLGDMLSPGDKKESTLDARLINPFRVEGLKEFSGPYNAMVEVPLICRDRQRLRDVEDLLKNYMSIVQRLETVDPRKLKNDEKIAFWINIHNALLMHAYLERGIPQNNVKKTSILVKVTCNIGGCSINAATIQSLILGCHTPCPQKWLNALLYPRIKSKAGTKWEACAIEQPEPLLRFALCSGSHSDPAVRVYTPKRLFQQLEAAKEEFIRASVGIWKEQKILLPKVIDSYAKDIKLTSQGLVDMVQRYLPETLRMAMQRCQQGRSNRIIEWVPYNLSFRYLLSRELAFPHIN